MLNLHFSNRTEVLAERLLATLAADAATAGDPFAYSELIVPSSALRRWLTLSIARERGICANVRFGFLAQWLWQRVAAADPSVPAQSPLASPVLAWRVHAVFADAAWVQAHPRLAHYLAQADAVMRYELAAAVAALFEQYTTYRPQWLQAWGRGDAALQSHPDEAWQAALWRRLARDLGLPEQHPLTAFVQAQRRGGATVARAAGLPARVHVFAPPALPPLHQQMLAELGRAIDVDVYLLNPCREYWFELVDRRRLAHLTARGQAALHEEGNRLLAGLGQQTQAMIEGLVDLGGDAVCDDGDYRAHPGRSLLAQVQNALLDLQPLAPGSVAMDATDRSIELHVCHSRLREVEVLHERLLSLFGEDTSLQPGDILVAMPDLAESAPLVEAVFGSAPAPRHIPFSISGRPRSMVDAPARALLATLDLLAGRMPVSAVFGLLQHPVVARRFGLDEEELARVHEWLHAAGVHWGLDAERRAGFDVPRADRHTLCDGMARLFLGHALPAGPRQPLAGLLPAADIAGSEARLLGRLWAYVHALQHWHATLSQPHTPERWAALLHDACTQFIAADGDERADLQELQARIGELIQAMQHAGLTEPQPLPLLRLALQQQLDDPMHGGTASGAVTFTAMGSLRALPFRVVCVLGLDDGLFPGPTRNAEFDLLAAQPQRGDRQRRLDERNLFLDLLLAARSHLHLSHTGRSVRDNARLPPSVLVAELLDVLGAAIATDPANRRSLDAAHQRVVVEHPLQPFSLRAFEVGGDPRLRSHDAHLADALRQSLAATAAPQAAPEPDARTAADADLDDPADTSDDDAQDGEGSAPPADLAGQPVFLPRRLPLRDPQWRAVRLEQLIEFFGQPCRTLLRRRLAIDLGWDADELSDEEPLLAERRMPRGLAKRLLADLVQGGCRVQAQQLAQAHPQWPGGPLGRLQFEQLLPAFERLAGDVRAATAAPAQAPLSTTLAFDLDDEPWTLAITLPGLRTDGQALWSAEPLRVSHRLEAWLRHLALCVAAPPGVVPRTRWLALDEAIAFTQVTGARARLEDLLRLYRQGLCEPLHFYPRTAWAFIDSEGRHEAAAKTWTPTPRQPFAEGADAAYRLALRGCAQPLDEAFVTLAHRVFDPLVKHLEGSATP